MVSIVYRLVAKTGQYTDYFWVWRSLKETTNTWKQLQAHFIKDQAYL